MFVAYARDRDRGHRDALLDAHANLAASCARRFLGRGEEFEDLHQVALIALVQALDRFDPGRGTEFHSFAVPTIVGALKRHLRDHSWVVRPSRRLQERYLYVARVVEDLAAELGRPPEVADIARRGTWTEDEVWEALGVAELRRPRTPSLDDIDHPAEASVHDDELARAELRAELRALLAELSPFERQVFEMRFFDDMTQMAIARRIGTSQMHVSRVLSRALARLRARCVDQVAS
jgi:RNA polymerase sigma-B factor